MLPFHRIIRFAEHEELKPFLLREIDKFDSSVLQTHNSYISRTDWHLRPEVKREYMTLFSPILRDILPPLYDTLGGKTLTISNYWFQQYYKNDVHEWHVHGGCMFSHIYYLELPEGAKKTEFKNPENINEIFTFDVQEGDILMFPSFYIHRSPPSEEDVRKTVIAFNTDMGN